MPARLLQLAHSGRVHPHLEREPRPRSVTGTHAERTLVGSTARRLRGHYRSWSNGPIDHRQKWTRSEPDQGPLTARSSNLEPAPGIGHADPSYLVLESIPSKSPGTFLPAAPQASACAGNRRQRVSRARFCVLAPARTLQHPGRPPVRPYGVRGVRRVVHALRQRRAATARSRAARDRSISACRGIPAGGCARKGKW